MSVSNRLELRARNDLTTRGHHCTGVSPRVRFQSQRRVMSSCLIVEGDGRFVSSICDIGKFLLLSLLGC